MFASIEVWAGAVNTALLIVLALVNAYMTRNQRRERRDLQDVKRGLGIARRRDDQMHHNGDEPKDTGERRRAEDHV